MGKSNGDTVSITEEKEPYRIRTRGEVSTFSGELGLDRVIALIELNRALSRSRDVS